jgi:hypothetical protein
MTDSNPSLHKARAVFEHDCPTLERSARALLERETLTEADLRPIFEKVTLPETTAGS